MRKIYLFFIALFAICSCSLNISSDNTDSDFVYLKLEKDNLIFDIDNVIAHTNNLSEQEFDAIIVDIQKANDILREIIADLKQDSSIKHIYIVDKDSNLFYDVYDEKYTSTVLYQIDSSVYYSPSIKYRSEISPGIPKGYIETDGSENKSQGGIWAPNGLQGIESNCQAKVATFATHFVTTRALGTAIVNSRAGNGTLRVPLDASNMYFTVSYATTDSNGGRCSWSGYM